MKMIDKSQNAFMKITVNIAFFFKLNERSGKIGENKK